MLDSTADIAVKQPAINLQGQRIIVLGACCGFGRSMVRTLTTSGAQVVVADANQETLKQMKGAVPLHLRGQVEVALRRAGRAWGEARLDAVLNLMPLRRPDEIDKNIAILQGVVQGFMPALTAKDGQIVTVVARPDQALDLAACAMAPALVSAQRALAHTLRRDGLTMNLISVGNGGVKPARTAIVGLLAKSMGAITGAELRV